MKASRLYWRGIVTILAAAMISAALALPGSLVSGTGGAILVLSAICLVVAFFAWFLGGLLVAIWRDS